jgi:hypothetical protein
MNDVDGLMVMSICSFFFLLFICLVTDTRDIAKELPSILRAENYFPFLESCSILNKPTSCDSFPTLESGCPALPGLQRTLRNYFQTLGRPFRTLGNVLVMLGSYFSSLGNQFPTLRNAFLTLGSAGQTGSRLAPPWEIIFQPRETISQDHKTASQTWTAALLTWERLSPSRPHPLSRQPVKQ